MFNGENLNLPYNQIEAMRKFIYSKVLNNVNHSNLSDSDKECIRDVFKKCEDRILTVNIVRCKDCVHLKQTKNGGWCKLHNTFPLNDYYCANGKKELKE